jgi:signal transduction histidine kinase/CheY-like chemotaxis protein
VLLAGALEALESHPDGFEMTDPDGRLVVANGRLYEVWGLSPEERARIEALGPTREAREALLEATALRAADAAAYRAGVAGAAAPLDGVRIDDVRLRDGRVLERYSAPLHDPQGRPSGRLGYFRDITERARSEADLRERARQQAAVAALGELAMCAEDLSPLLHAACATVLETMRVDAAVLLELTADGGGYAVRAAAGLSPAVVGTTVAAEAGTHLATIVTSGSTIAARAGCGPDGDPFLREHGLCCGATVALHGRDAPLGALGAYLRGRREFTPDDLRFLEAIASVLAAAVARHRAEADVLDRERQMRAVFDAALDAMLIVSPGGAILDANPAACALFARPRSALVRHALRDLEVAAPGAETLDGRLRGLADLGRIAGETEVTVPGQPVRAVEFAAVADILPGRHLAVLRDVTERRLLHARLALADRMVSVGTLAAGVAHELNNPLAYVNANLAFLAERLDALEAHAAKAIGPPAAADLVTQLEDALRDARDGAERMRVIVRDLKTFSRAEEERSGPVELHPVLESCVHMAWNEIRHRARLRRDLAPVPPVTGNEARLGQVFLNLLVNAAHAIPEGRVAENEIVVRTLPAGGRRVAVEIRDTGCGIPPENLKRIFDPFFTTKPPGVGTGLGLSICHGIVSALGGEIEVESVPGRGSTFRVVLPAADPAVEARRPESVVEARPRGRILDVDDEPLVGTVIQRTLQGQHDVTVVSSARAALERLDAGERFDLVLTDLLMPEMSGMDLHRELVRRDPDLARRTVFLTGGAFTPAAREFLERESVECVEKPFELAPFRALLARKLGG